MSFKAKSVGFLTFFAMAMGGGYLIFLTITQPVVAQNTNSNIDPRCRRIEDCRERCAYSGTGKPCTDRCDSEAKAVGLNCPKSTPECMKIRRDTDRACSAKCRRMDTQCYELCSRDGRNAGLKCEETKRAQEEMERVKAEKREKEQQAQREKEMRELQAQRDKEQLEKEKRERESWGDYEGSMSYDQAISRCNQKNMKPPGFRDIRNAYDSGLTKNWQPKGFYWTSDVATARNPDSGLADMNVFNISDRSDKVESVISRHHLRCKKR